MLKYRKSSFLASNEHELADPQLHHEYSLETGFFISTPRGEKESTYHDSHVCTAFLVRRREQLTFRGDGCDDIFDRNVSSLIPALSPSVPYLVRILAHV